MSNRFGRYLVHAADQMSTATNKAMDKAAGATANGIKRAGRAMVKDTDPNIANLWTGKRESKLAVGLAVGGVAAFSAVHTDLTFNKGLELQPKVGQISYGGAAPIMNADGVSSTPQAPMTNAPSLGASGQMVFGLHNARKG